MLYAIIVVVVLVLTYFYKRRKTLDFSGPPAWPVLGNLPDIEQKRIHVILDNWAKQYGKIYKINLFGEEVSPIN